MLRAIIRFSAENKYLVIAATVVALFGAWWTLRNIPLDALPDLSDTQVIVYGRLDRSPDIDEDQVTGSAHCALAPYWAAKLGKTEMTAFQASPRGGELRVRVAGDRVFIAGQAVSLLRSELLVA